MVISDVPDIEKLMKTTNPLHVVPSPKEHTSVYVLLASNKDARAITGVIINSDGGLGVRGFHSTAGGEHL